MIVDMLGNADLYAASSHRFKEAFEWLRAQDLESLPEGTVTIREGEILAIVQRYDTVAQKDRQFESHRRFVDIQYVVSGHERMLVTPVDSLQIDGLYDEEKDLAFHGNSAEWSELVLGDGMFAIFYPHEAHMPMVEVSPGSAGRVTKVVMKVAV